MLPALEVHTATVETYLGATPRGDGYAPPVAVKGFLDDGVIRMESGGTERLVQQVKFYTAIANAALFTPESKVTVNGRIGQVTRTRRREAGTMFRAVEHLEVELT